jgi:hypothetical protein
LARIQTPDKSGLPSAVRGAGASISTLPWASRGTSGAGNFGHCAPIETAEAAINPMAPYIAFFIAPHTNTDRSFRRPPRRKQRPRRTDQTQSALRARRRHMDLCGFCGLCVEAVSAGAVRARHSSAVARRGGSRDRREWIKRRARGERGEATWISAGFAASALKPSLRSPPRSARVLR